MAILEVRDLKKKFGGLGALDGLDLDAYDSEILGIIGPNGAGKTTLFNVISGFYKPTVGKISFQGEVISGLRPDQIAGKGIGRTFQDLSLCMQSTVFENVFTAFHKSYSTGLWSAFFHTKAVAEEEKTLKKKAMEIIDFMGLTVHKDKLAANLSSGFKKALSLSVAFATNPKLLLLDEPATTLSPDKVEMIMNLVLRVRETGTTVVIIEHSMKAIMEYCDRIVVIANGKKLAEGKAKEISENKEVVEAYLGEVEENVS
jgi:branched-chain amino acid transport system ATP-binding protein